MRILHLISYFNDHLDYQENKLIELQNQNGHEVCLITSDRFFPFKDYNNNYYNILGERVQKKNTYNYKNVKIIRKKIFFETKKYSQCFFFNLKEIIIFKPEIVHFHNCGVYTFFFGFLYCVFSGKKIFIDCHQDYTNTKNSLFFKIHNFIWAIIYFIFNFKISLFLPINEASKIFLQKNYYIKEKKIKILPLGYEKYNKSVFNYKKVINNFKFREFFKDEAIIILNSGKQNKSKKIDQLIEFTKIINRKNITCKLLLIGNSGNEYKKILKDKITNLERIFGNKRILILPTQKKEILRYFLQLSNIAIWPGVPSITIQESLYSDNLLMLPQNSSSYNLLTSKNLTFHQNLLTSANNIIRIIQNKNLLFKIKLRNKQILRKLEWKKINDNLENFYKEF